MKLKKAREEILAKLIFATKRHEPIFCNEVFNAKCATFFWQLEANIKKIRGKIFVSEMFSARPHVKSIFRAHRHRL